MRRTCLILLLLNICLFSALVCFAIDEPTFSNISQNVLRDVKGPVNFPSNIIFYVIIVLALLAGVIAAMIRHLKNKKEKEEEVPVDTRMPWEIAYEQFDDLEKSSLLEKGQFKTFYSKFLKITYHRYIILKLLVALTKASF